MQHNVKTPLSCWDHSRCNFPIDWCSNEHQGPPSEGAGVWISYKSCSYFPITFLSSDLHCVITSWTVIFKFPHSQSFNPGTGTDRQSITGLLYLAESPTAPCWCRVTLFDLVLLLTSNRQSYRGELPSSLWQLIVLLICNVNSGYYISNRHSFKNVSGLARPNKKRKENEPLLMTIDSFRRKQPLPFFTWPRCWSWINTAYNFGETSFSLAQQSGLAWKATYISVVRLFRWFRWLADILFSHERHVTQVATVFGRAVLFHHFQLHELFIVICCNVE